MEVQIREMVLSDYEAVVALWCSTPGFIVRPVTDSRDEIEPLLARTPSLSVIAVDDDGVVNLPRVRRHDGRRDDWSESDQRILGDFGEFAPRDEPRSELFAIERSAQQMPLEREMLPDRPEA
jgi:hypothetical protein